VTCLWQADTEFKPKRGRMWGHVILKEAPPQVETHLRDDVAYIPTYARMTDAF